MRNGSKSTPPRQANRAHHRASSREDARVNAINWRYTWTTRQANLVRHARDCGQCEIASEASGIYPRCQTGKRLARLVHQAEEMVAEFTRQASPQGPRQTVLF